MASTLVDWWTFTLGPSGWAVLLVTLIAIVLPLGLHLYWFSPRTSTALPTFLLVGPSGAGKTSLLTLFERGSPATTHTSQKPLAAECLLPADINAASNKYRSANDPGSAYHRKFLLLDTPGHGKLRNHALENINNTSLKGVVFLVDAAGFGADAGGSTATLSDTAGYLHDLLLALQKRNAGSKSSEMPVLIAVNKLDLFTASPPKLVKLALENELDKLRSTKSRGLLDSGITTEDDLDERETLGGAGEGKFNFALLQEYNINIATLGGSVHGSNGNADVLEWWNWIASHL